MALASPPLQHQLASLYLAARRDTCNGVVAATQKVRLRYWTHWAHFCANIHQLDPFLRNTPIPARVELAQAFARYVRDGHAGRGHRVRVGSVQTALCAVGKTFQLAHLPSPIYRSQHEDKHWHALTQQLNTYRREDPPTEPQLAAPLALPEWLLHEAHHAPAPSRNRSAQQSDFPSRRLDKPATPSPPLQSGRRVRKVLQSPHGFPREFHGDRLRNGKPPSR